MRRPQGYGIETRDGKVIGEEDSFTCGHCNTIVFVKPRQDPADMGGLCKLCMRLTCPVCAGKASCDPFEKKLERMESRDRLLRSLIG